MNLKKLIASQILASMKCSGYTKMQAIKGVLFTKTVEKNETTYYKYIVHINSSIAFDVYINEENNILISNTKI